MRLSSLLWYAVASRRNRFWGLRLRITVAPNFPNDGLKSQDETEFCLKVFLDAFNTTVPLLFSSHSSGFNLHSSPDSREITFCRMQLSVSLSCIFNVLNYLCFSCLQYFIICKTMTPSSPRATIPIFAEIYGNCAPRLTISPRKCSVDLLYLINTSSILD